MTNSDETTLDAKKELFNKFNKRIDELYTFRDKYYILNENSKSIDDRNQELLKRLNEFAAELESIDAERFESKASHLVLIGRAFNLLPDYNQRAFDTLTKAIKLDPTSVEAWNFLGECYWKKRDFDMCRNCFERSLSIQPNKMSLRGMSMVSRQLINVPVTKEQLNSLQQNNSHDNNNSSNNNSRQMRIRNLLEDSIRYAKEAVKMDARDGMSWHILANCYAAKFFSPFGQENCGLLKQAVSAYALAIKDDTVASLQSDLYFNKSMISMYEEDWNDVLVCLCKAIQLDPHMGEIRDNFKGTIDYLTQLNELTAQKGKLKSKKKFQALLESMKKSDLGPYGEALEECMLKELRKGRNSSKVLMGKVVCGLPRKSSDNFNIVCFTCCIADANGDCAALTIYNLAGGEGLIIGNSVAVPEPWCEEVDFNFQVPDKLLDHLSDNNNTTDDADDQQKKQKKELAFKFKSIRVENPAVLVVNGRKWTKEKISSAFFVPKVLDD